MNERFREEARRRNTQRKRDTILLFVFIAIFLAAMIHWLLAGVCLAIWLGLIVKWS